jgi:hypothetical protein
MLQGIRILPCLLGALVAACSPVPDTASSKIEHLTVPIVANPEGPRLSTGPDGRTILSWMEPDERGTTLWYSSLADDGWSPRRSVVSGRDMFVNWADMPSVLALAGDHWAAHWLEMAGHQTYSYHVQIAQSFDAGRTWTDPVKPHRDESPTEHGFVTLFAHADSVGAIWLDGRKTGAGMSSEPASTGMTLRAARLDQDGQLHDEVEIDDLVCDCCQTDVALGTLGPVAVYRDRTPQEIRDIAVAQHVDEQWQPATPLHDDQWQIGGCPVNGPSLAARGNRMAAAWFSMPGGKATVRVKFSDNSGRTFGDTIDVSTDNPVGRADTVLLPDGSAAVSWLQPDIGGAATLHLRRIGPESQRGPAIEVARNLPARSSPQLALAGDDIILAWTEKKGGITRIASARMAVDELTAM